MAYWSHFKSKRHSPTCPFSKAYKSYKKKKNMEILNVSLRGHTDELYDLRTERGNKTRDILLETQKDIPTITPRIFSPFRYTYNSPLLPPLAHLLPHRGNFYRNKTTTLVNCTTWSSARAWATRSTRLCRNGGTSSSPTRSSRSGWSSSTPKAATPPGPPSAPGSTACRPRRSISFSSSRTSSRNSIPSLWKRRKSILLDWRYYYYYYYSSFPISYSSFFGPGDIPILFSATL